MSGNEAISKSGSFTTEVTEEAFLVVLFIRILTELADSEDIGEKNLASLMAHVGDLQEHSGNYDDARVSYEKSTELAEKASLPRVAAVGQAQLAKLALIQGKFSSAAGLVLAPLEFFRASGEPAMVADLLSTSGHIAMGVGDYCEAEECFRQSLRIRDELPSGAHIAADCYALGQAAAAMGRVNEAEEWWTRAVAAFEELGDLGRALASGRFVYELFAKLKDESRCRRWEKYRRG